MNKEVLETGGTELTKEVVLETGNLDIDTYQAVVPVLIQVTNFRFWLHANH